MDWFVKNTSTFLKESKGIQKMISLLDASPPMPLRLMVDLLTPYSTALKLRKIVEFEELAIEGFKVTVYNV